MEIPVRRASERFNPLSTMYPESQKMGNPTMKPVIPIARDCVSFTDLAQDETPP